MPIQLKKLCKIVATLGPASDAPERIRSLALAGVDAFRLNFSHGNHEEHAVRLKNVRLAEEMSGKFLPVIADMQGPKIRVGELHGGEEILAFNSTVELICEKVSNKQGVLPIPHPELFDALQPGDVLMLDDGMMQLTLIENNGRMATAKVTIPGLLTNKKGINIPGRRLPIAALTPKDHVDLKFALEAGVDYIALSFVQKAADVEEARAIIGVRAGIISKIEKPSALDELDAIIAASDAVMVARGDLGVELPLEQVPIAQRRIIRRARAAGKPVIVATQMLQSMIDSPTPTRAEASDTAAAVYSGADAVMLSAESAIGRHPEAVVAIISRIIQAVEQDETYWRDLRRLLDSPEADGAGAISLSARYSSELLGCKAILASTKTGSTAFAVSRERPRADIIAITPAINAARRVNLAWGISAVIVPDYDTFEDLDLHAREIAKSATGVKSGDTVLLTAGIPMGIKGGTNTMKVITL